MKRASYRFGVSWIAMNDNLGTDSPANPEAEENIAGYISTNLLAEMFGEDVERVAKDVMRIRKREAKLQKGAQEQESGI